MFFSRSCLAWLGTILQRDSVQDLCYVHIVQPVWLQYTRSFCEKNKVCECAERFCGSAVKKILNSRGTNILKELSELVLSQLKGYCHEIFDFRFFSWISSPKPLSNEYSNRAVSNRGLGDDDSLKKPEVKILVTLSLPENIALQSWRNSIALNLYKDNSTDTSLIILNFTRTRV